MASAPKEKQACLRDVAPLEEQLKLSPRTKSYSRNTKKEKIQAKRGGLTRGLRLLRNRDRRTGNPGKQRMRRLPFSCVLDVEHIQTESKGWHRLTQGDFRALGT